MSLPRFFHKRDKHNLRGRGGSMHLCIFVLVSPVKGKTMICLKNRENNNSLSEQFLLWPHARASFMVESGGAFAPRRRMRNHATYNI